MYLWPSHISLYIGPYICACIPCKVHSCSSVYACFCQTMCAQASECFHEIVHSSGPSEGDIEIVAKTCQLLLASILVSRDNSSVTNKIACHCARSIRCLYNGVTHIARGRLARTCCRQDDAFSADAVVWHATSSLLITHAAF